VSGVGSYLGGSASHVAIRFAALMSGFLVLHYKKDRRQDVVEVRSLNAGAASHKFTSFHIDSEVRFILV